jgi:D-aminoacyl-tRNA deacylase
MPLCERACEGETSQGETLMRAVIQRVSRASVTVGGEVVGRIDKGLLVLLGVAEHDTQDDVIYLAAKIVGLRIFPDNEGKMNRSLLEVGGRMLVVSQFTLLGDCRKGRRPSFIEAARPEQAVELYRGFVAEVRGQGAEVETGRFQEHMDVELVNDGPVTLILDTREVREAAKG